MKGLKRMPKFMVQFSLLFVSILLCLSCEPDANNEKPASSTEVRIPWKSVLNYAALMDDDSLLVVTSLDSIFKVGKSGKYRTYTGFFDLGNTSFSTDNQSIVMFNPGGTLLRVDKNLKGTYISLGTIITGNWKLHHDKAKQKLLLLVQQLYQVDYNFMLGQSVKSPQITDPAFKDKFQFLGGGFGVDQEYILGSVQNGSVKEYYLGKGNFSSTFNQFTRLPSSVPQGSYVIEGKKYLIINNMVGTNTSVITNTILSSGESFISSQIVATDGSLRVITNGGTDVFIKTLNETNSSVSLGAPLKTFPKSSIKFLGYDGKNVLSQDKSSQTIIIDQF